MAKKKRKHFIKLNNKIKSLFNGEPFEDIVTQLSDDALYGLLMLLEEDIGSLERDDIIKYLRRLWSEGDFRVRKLIVDYLEDHKRDIESSSKDKVDLILSFLDSYSPTPQEEEIILSDFIDKKLSKITPKKVKNKLFYLRKLKILNVYEELLDIEFTNIQSIEFTEAFILPLDEHDININLVCTIDIGISTSDLIKKEKDEIIELLNAKKAKAKEIKEQELQDFIVSCRQISYLDSKVLDKIFKQVNEPIRDLYHTPVSLKIAKKIVRSFSKSIEVSANKLNFLISKDFVYSKYNQELEHSIYINYEKRVLYSSIWTNKVSEIVKEMESRRVGIVAHFEQYIESMLLRIKEAIYPLEMSEEEIESYTISFLVPYIKTNRSLELKEKLIKRAIYHFNERYKEQKKRELLLAKTIRDFKKLFPVARSLNREIIFNVGPTNSGKTYSALKELKEADSGLYLAPLRLLAQEGYEDLKSCSIGVSLITGEEEIIDEESTHISSTIEMLNSDIEVEVCVIDEVQMIKDRDRGWAWANALIGAPAKRVILTGSSDALDVVKAIAEYLGEELKVVEFKRKNSLELLSSPTLLDAIEEATAIVTFSRKDVLAIKSKLAGKFTTSVVYGNLSPEVRREEAKRFREGKSQVLIATDAIAMGLNLPIKTLLFAKDNKFDGLQRRELTTTEILQIAGRAGRYGLHESGYVGALEHPTLSTIKAKFNKELKPIELPISVMASLEHVLLIGDILQTDNLYTILDFFASNMEFDGPFVAANIDSMLEVAKIVDEYKLDLVSKYHLACAPVSISSPHIQKAFNRYLRLLQENKEVKFLEPNIKSKKAISYSALLSAEDIVKEVSLYLWLSFKFGEHFKDIDIANRTRDKLNSYIERSLKESDFKKQCSRCGKVLDLSYKFSICDRCHTRAKRGYVRASRSNKKRERRWIEYI